MRKLTRVILILIILIIAIGVIWYGGSKSDDNDRDDDTPDVSETIKVSSTLSEYKNAELGFQVQYPSVWQNEEANSGVTFIIPIDKTQVSTIGTLQASIQAQGGVCAFPPLTTVKDRATIKVNDLSFNTISMSNTVQGRAYFNRMYSLQKDEVCYMFVFTSITLSPASKNLTGSNLTQAENNNKALINTADVAFTNMVKSFSFVSGPQGVDETTVKVTPKVTPTSATSSTPKKP
jgi:hypothetical protein